MKTFHLYNLLIAVLIFAALLDASSYARGVARTAEGYARASTRLSLATYSNRLWASSALSLHFRASYARASEDSKRKYMEYVNSIFPKDKKKNDGKMQAEQYLTVIPKYPAPFYGETPKHFVTPLNPYNTAIQMSNETICSLAQILFCSSAPLPKSKNNFTIDHPECSMFGPIYDQNQEMDANMHLITYFDKQAIYFGVKMLWTKPRQSLNGPAEDAVLVRLEMLKSLENVFEVVKACLASHRKRYPGSDYVHPQVFFAGYGTGGLGALWLAYRYLESGFLEDNSCNAVKVVTWEEDQLHLKNGKGVYPKFTELHDRLGKANHLVWTTTRAEDYRRASEHLSDFVSAGGIPVLLSPKKYQEVYSMKENVPYRPLTGKMTTEYLLNPYAIIADRVSRTKSVEKVKLDAIRARNSAYIKLSRRMDLDNNQPSPWGSCAHAIAMTDEESRRLKDKENVEYLLAHFKHLNTFYEMSDPDHFARGIEATFAGEAEQWARILEEDIITNVFPRAQVNCKHEGSWDKAFSTISSKNFEKDSTGMCYRMGSLQSTSKPSPGSITKRPSIGSHVDPKAPRFQGVFELASRNVPKYTFEDRIWKASCTVHFRSKAIPMLYQFYDPNELRLEFVGSRKRVRIPSAATRSLQSQRAAESEDGKASAVPPPLSSNGTDIQARNLGRFGKIVRSKCFLALTSAKSRTILGNALELKDLSVRMVKSRITSTVGLPDSEFCWTPSRFIYKDMYRMFRHSPSIFVEAFVEPLTAYPEGCLRVLPLHMHPIKLPGNYNKEATPWSATHRYHRRTLQTFFTAIQGGTISKSISRTPPPRTSGIFATIGSIRSPHPGVLVDPRTKEELAYRVNMLGHNIDTFLPNTSSFEPLLKVLSTPPTRTFAVDGTNKHNRLLPRIFPEFFADRNLDPISKHMLLIPNTKLVLSIVPASWVPYGNRSLTDNFVAAVTPTTQPWVVIEAVPEDAGVLQPHLYWSSFRAYLFTRP